MMHNGKKVRMPCGTATLDSNSTTLHRNLINFCRPYGTENKGITVESSLFSATIGLFLVAYGCQKINVIKNKSYFPRRYFQQPLNATKIRDFLQARKSH
jgi:hypothetical protein